MWARYGRDVGEMWVRCGRDVGEMEDAAGQQESRESRASQDRRVRRSGGCGGAVGAAAGAAGAAGSSAAVSEAGAAVSEAEAVEAVEAAAEAAKSMAPADSGGSGKCTGTGYPDGPRAATGLLIEAVRMILQRSLMHYSGQRHHKSMRHYTIDGGITVVYEAFLLSGVRLQELRRLASERLRFVRCDGCGEWSANVVGCRTSRLVSRVRPCVTVANANRRGRDVA